MPLAARKTASGDACSPVKNSAFSDEESAFDTTFLPPWNASFSFFSTADPRRGEEVLRVFDLECKEMFRDVRYRGALHRLKNHKHELRLVRCFPESLANNRCNGSRLCLWMCHISADILRTRERDIKGKNNCARDIVVLGNAREYACTRILHDSLECPTRLASSFPYVFLFV